MSVFGPADLLIPDVEDMAAWSVIACDQFTSQPEYWDAVRDRAGDAPSSLRLILPEVELASAGPERIGEIDRAMERYLRAGLFREHRDAYVYLERTLLDGSIRRGLVGAIDLEAYDWRPGATAAIRATERTVPERLPPRMAVRRGASLELSHAILLCEDEDRGLLGPLQEAKPRLPRLYGFDLMMGGGHIDGWLVQGAEAEALGRRMEAYVRGRAGGSRPPFAVGDGNHSLAAAKACYEELERGSHAHPARYAMVELEDIHDPALRFEPIHRLVTSVDVDALLHGLEGICAPDGHLVVWHARGRSGTLRLDRARGALAVGILQEHLDGWLADDAGQIDYIHGDDVLARLAERPGSVGLQLPPIDKGELFGWIATEGALPRKTFSMGHAQEKRYYLEARELRTRGASSLEDERARSCGACHPHLMPDAPFDK